MATLQEFEDATVRIKQATRLAPAQLLRLYALFKQATVGDVCGEGPGVFDFKGRAKHEAWEAAKGLGAEAARAAYVEFVNELVPGTTA